MASFPKGKSRGFSEGYSQGITPLNNYGDFSKVRKRNEKLFLFNSAAKNMI